MDLNYDVLIIGSGISALSCASILAARGKKVGIVERYTKYGGYLHTFNRFGNEYETGSHYVGAMNPGEPFDVLLRYFGIEPEEIFAPLNQRNFDQFSFPGFEFSLASSYEETQKNLATIFPSEEAGIEKFLGLCRQVALKFPTYEFNETVDPQSLLEYLNTPLSTVVNSITENRELKTALYTYCSLHCVAPKDVPFGFHAVMFDSFMRGAYGFKQSGAQLADRMVENLKNFGVDIFLRHEITSIGVENRLVTHLETKRGKRLTADWYVSSIHPKTTFALTGLEHFKPAFRKRIEEMRESVPLFGVYAAVENPPELEFDRNYYIFQSADPDQFDYLDNPPDFDEDLPLAVYLARNNRSGKPGQKGLQPMTIHAPAVKNWFSTWSDSRYGKRPQDYQDFKKRYSELLINVVDKKFPGFASSIVDYESSSPLSNEYFNGSVDGTAYGIYHSIENTGMRALGPRTHIKNLLLTGQNTLFPGLLSSTIAGLRTAGHVVGIKSIIKELRELKERSISSPRS